MDEDVPESQGGERRREPRIRVAGVVVLQGGAQPPSVWRVTNLSLGGASLVGDGALLPASFSVGIHVGGFPVVDVNAKVLRRQLVTRAGKCAVKFVNVSETALETLHDILEAGHAPLLVRRRALIVDRDQTPMLALSAELASLGFTVRRETTPEQAAAWLQREDTEVLLVGESVVGSNGWSLLEFVRDTAPEIRRLVLAEDVRGFRLYYAIKAGLVDGLVGRETTGDTLARHVLGAAPAESRPSRPSRTARRSK
jgi:ActR/RegA family two-component response regulator